MKNFSCVICVWGILGFELQGLLLFSDLITAGVMADWMPCFWVSVLIVCWFGRTYIFGDEVSTLWWLVVEENAAEESFHGRRKGNTFCRTESISINVVAFDVILSLLTLELAHLQLWSGSHLYSCLSLDLYLPGWIGFALEDRCGCWVGQSDGCCTHAVELRL